MSIDMSSNFFKLLLHFRRQDLTAFSLRHAKLFEEAMENGDHHAVTAHYYSVMSAVIDQYFSGCFHFAPPSHDNQTLEDALRVLHQEIGKRLDLRPEAKCVDIGCGIGGVMRDLADSGALLTGITISPNEVEIGNAVLEREGLAEQCRILHGDAAAMPLPAAESDAAYAVYSLKYLPRLEPVFNEVNRILKPGGRFLVYDLMTTEAFERASPEQKEIVSQLEFACGMPALHSRKQTVQIAQENGLDLVEEEDLSETFGRPFHFCFSHSPFFMWLVKSPTVGFLIKIAQALHILPAGFYSFNRTFLSGTVEKIVEAGKAGILSGSRILVFQKKNSDSFPAQL